MDDLSHPPPSTTPEQEPMDMEDQRDTEYSGDNLRQGGIGDMQGQTEAEPTEEIGDTEQDEEIGDMQGQTAANQSGHDEQLGNKSDRYTPYTPALICANFPSTTTVCEPMFAHFRKSRYEEKYVMVSGVSQVAALEREFGRDENDEDFDQENQVLHSQNPCKY